MSDINYTTEEFKIAHEWLIENKGKTNLCFPDLLIEGMRLVKNITYEPVLVTVTCYTCNVTKGTKPKGDNYCSMCDHYF